MELEKKPAEYIIHNKIISLCEAKGIKLSNFKKLNISDFNNIFNSSGIFDYDGVNEEGIKHKILMISLSSQYIKKSGLNKYINSNFSDVYYIITTTNKIITIDDPNKEVYFIDGKEAMLRNFNKYFENKGIEIKLLNNEEVDYIKDFLFISDLNSLPKIKMNCQECIYSKAKPGDVMEIKSVSATTSGLTSCLRLVIK